MKELIKQYLDQGLSRRKLVSGLSALGMSTVAAKAVAQNLAPLGPGGGKTAAPARRRRPRRSAKSKATAASCSSSSSSRPASNTSSSIRRPATIRSSTRWSMCPRSRSSRASRKARSPPWRTATRARRAAPACVVVANIGLPNAMTQMVNTYKDQIPMLVAVASIDQNALGRDQWQETDHHELMTQPITKWFWQAQSTAAIAETTRRGAEIRFDAAVRAGVPVAADQYARPARQGADLGTQQIRRADAHPSRQGGCRESGAHADRSQESAASASATKSPGAAATKNWSNLPSCSARRSPARPVRSATGRSRSRPGIRCSSARCCAPCAFPASPTCCSISAIAGANWRRPAPS